MVDVADRFKIQNPLHDQKFGGDHGMRCVVVLQHCCLVAGTYTPEENGRASDDQYNPLLSSTISPLIMKLVVPALLLLRSIPATALASEANATLALEHIQGTTTFAPIINDSGPMPRDLAETDSTAVTVESLQRIIGGEETGSVVDYMVDFIGDLSTGGTVICAGTLIAPKVVLTAAACLTRGTPGKVFVNLYDKTNLADVEIINVGPDDYVIHPDYDTPRFANNVGLIILENDVTNADTIQYPKLNEESDEPADGDPLLVMGWGTTSYGGVRSDVLLQAQVDYMTNDVCSSKYTPDEVVITDGTICAAKDGKDRCAGDGGGPLMLNNANSNLRTNPVQVGISSWTLRCLADTDKPSGYARVSHFVDWIKQTACDEAGELCPEPSTEPSSIPSDSPFASPSGMPSTSIQPTNSKSSKTSKRTKTEKITIRASLNKSGASYPCPSTMIGVALALNVVFLAVTGVVL